MKSVFAVFLIVCTSQSAHALKPASKDELAELTAIFVTIKDVGELIDENRASYDNASPKKKAELDQKLLLLKEEREAPCRQAMWLTMKAYDILPFAGDMPILPKGTSYLRSPQIGKEITWIPVFEEKKPYELQNAVGRTAYKNVQLTDTAGNTASDGVSRIFPDAFTSPASLAARIYHERVHFEQFTTSKLAGVMTPAELEVDAYSKEKIVWQANRLGMTSDELEDEDDYLKDNLAKYKAKAAIQRAKVKKAKGLPIDEYSIKSLPEDQLAGLVDQARKQLAIAHRDHDERLESTINPIATRSAKWPGSVTQAELDKLPQRHAKNGSFMANPSVWESAYLYLYNGGRDADELRRLSMPPMKPINPQPQIPGAPAPVQGIPVPPAMFSTVLPDLKDFAIAACRAPEQVALEKFLYRPYDHSAGAYDGNAANLLATGLGDCPRQLFKQMIATIRDGQGVTIDRQWIRSKVAAYTPETGTTPGYTPPQTGGGDPCRDNGNIRCP